MKDDMYVGGYRGLYRIHIIHDFLFAHLHNPESTLVLRRPARGQRYDEIPAHSLRRQESSTDSQDVLKIKLCVIY